ncbi:hypothetical protein C7M84_018234 [Penaeus vannamei]|uniref:Uncharacterized protein n=1 Tax=Penaeus vannamei TaxID=6689 RepID=A0A3R7MK65_PENVA|nr:hypothetical protein C7M84_018234 [Penaeus vannamei]
MECMTILTHPFQSLLIPSRETWLTYNRELIRQTPAGRGADPTRVTGGVVRSAKVILIHQDVCGRPLAGTGCRGFWSNKSAPPSRSETTKASPPETPDDSRPALPLLRPEATPGRNGDEGGGAFQIKGTFFEGWLVRRTQGRETTASPDQNNGRGELPPGREPFSLSPSWSSRAAKAVGHRLTAVKAAHPHTRLLPAIPLRTLELCKAKGKPRLCSPPLRLLLLFSLHRKQRYATPTPGNTPHSLGRWRAAREKPGSRSRPTPLHRHRSAPGSTAGPEGEPAPARLSKLHPPTMPNDASVPRGLRLARVFQPESPRREQGCPERRGLHRVSRAARGGRASGMPGGPAARATAPCAEPGCSGAGAARPDHPKCARLRTTFVLTQGSVARNAAGRDQSFKSPHERRAGASLIRARSSWRHSAPLRHVFVSALARDCGAHGNGVQDRTEAQSSRRKKSARAHAQLCRSVTEQRSVRLMASYPQVWLTRLAAGQKCRDAPRRPGQSSLGHQHRAGARALARTSARLETVPALAAGAPSPPPPPVFVHPRPLTERWRIRKGARRPRGSPAAAVCFWRGRNASSPSPCGAPQDPEVEERNDLPTTSPSKCAFIKMPPPSSPFSLRCAWPHQRESAESRPAFGGLFAQLKSPIVTITEEVEKSERKEGQAGRRRAGRAARAAASCPPFFDREGGALFIRPNPRHRSRKGPARHILGELQKVTLPSGRPLPRPCPYQTLDCRLTTFLLEGTSRSDPAQTTVAPGTDRIQSTEMSTPRSAEPSGYSEPPGANGMAAPSICYVRRVSAHHRLFLLREHGASAPSAGTDCEDSDAATFRRFRRHARKRPPDSVRMLIGWIHMSHHPHTARLPRLLTAPERRALTSPRIRP